MASVADQFVLLLCLSVANCSSSGPSDTTDPNNTVAKPVDQLRINPGELRLNPGDILS